MLKIKGEEDLDFLAYSNSKHKSNIKTVLKTIFTDTLKIAPVKDSIVFT